jgi:CIC family chloride channel protein
MTEISATKRRAIIYFFSIVMGVIGGFVAVILRYLIVIFEYIFRVVLLSYMTIQVGSLNLGYILLPAIGGLLVGLIINRYALETKGSGIPEILEATALRAGNIPKHVGFMKMLVVSMTLGSGGSAGREGPIAMIGASMGSLFGTLFHLKPQEKRLLMTCGLAAGISGSFDAPIGGALFGLEILYQGGSLLGGVPVFISSVIGTAIAGAFFGHHPVFEIAFELEAIRPVEYVLFLVTGVLFGFIAFAWVKYFYWTQSQYGKLKIPDKYKPAVGGLLTGGIIMFFPEYGIFGTGFEGMELALVDVLIPLLMLLLGILKMVATANTIGSGGSGGVFGPSMYIGCMFGGFIGYVFQFLFPTIVSSPLIYCLIGMAALFSAAAQAPLNNTVLIVEMSEHFDVFPPLLIGSVLSFFIARLLFKDSSIYTLKLERRGIDFKIDSMYKMEKLHVDEVMTKTLVTIPANLPLEDVIQMQKDYDVDQFPVVEFGKIIGLLYCNHASACQPDKLGQLTAKDVLITNYISVSPQDNMQNAMDVMYSNKVKALLVVEINVNEDGIVEKKLEGILTENDIRRAWTKKPLE